MRKRGPRADARPGETPIAEVWVGLDRVQGSWWLSNGRSRPDPTWGAYGAVQETSALSRRGDSVTKGGPHVSGAGRGRAVRGSRVAIRVVDDVGAFEGALSAVALAFEGEDVDVVDESVDGRDDRGLVCEDALPGAECSLLVTMSERVFVARIRRTVTTCPSGASKSPWTVPGPRPIGAAGVLGHPDHARLARRNRRATRSPIQPPAVALPQFSCPPLQKGVREPLPAATAERDGIP